MDDISDPVLTTKKARAVIEELARRKGTFTDEFRQEAEEEAEHGRKGMLQALKGGDEIREDLAKALKIISTDLYTNRARFLMEVIQNADDNNYVKGETPTVSIAIFPKYVQIACNEVGFSQKNIQALCRTGRSSKALGKGYTGEKGIGFKSVFKLANRAHIRSHPFYFQLDQARDLGMITPQWDEDFFEDYKKEHQTTIILDRICKPSTSFSTALKEDVDAIDPILILFLRRIERLHLTLFCSISKDIPIISKRVRRGHWTPDSGIVSLKDEDTNEKRYLYKHRFPIDFDGTESRRPAITSTDIVLAFPVKKQSTTYVPLIQKRNSVFAFLPLGDFGFKFVIQADFLTTSNRQSVDEDSVWNLNIASQIPLAFEAAIDDFNFNEGDTGLDELAVTWPLYLNDKIRGLSVYWRGVGKLLKKHLSRALVIRDRTGEVKKPKSLMFLDWAHDRHGEPMFGDGSDYVSTDYPDSVREALLSLDVTTPSWEWLCSKLQEMHDDGLLRTRRGSKIWSSDLAKVILKPQEPMGDRKYARDLKGIPLIPLADGSWRCPPPKDEPIYFPASLGTTIPPGLPLSLVDTEACACPKRNKLFRLLGVKECDVPNIIERIFHYHANFGAARDVHLIAQLRYLYTMREHLQPDDMRKIRFVCSSTEYRYIGNSTYVDISIDSELRQLFSGCNGAQFLDTRYFEDLDSFASAKLADWLCETFRVAFAPRLIATSGYGLHRDFEWLLDNKSDQVLATLRQHWNLYKKDLKNLPKDSIASRKFICNSGDQAALHATYLPLPSLVTKMQAFGDAENCNFLAVPTGDPNNWKFLSKLGVGLDDGLTFYLWVLKQSGFTNHIDVGKSKQLYLAIQKQVFFHGEEVKVRNAFGNDLINFPGNEYKRLKSCVWHGPKGFSSKPVLYPVYGLELRHLFQVVLEVPNVTSTEALEYLKQLSDDESATMADVAEVYVFLQKHCANTQVKCRMLTGIMLIGNRFNVDDQTACIAMPSSSGSALEWKTPAQCVWGEEEFSQNELKLESKTAVRYIIEQHAPLAKPFFTEVLKLPNAGIKELLADLALMQKKKCDNPGRVHRLYERIESCRRSWPDKIKKAFKKKPLIFLRGINHQSGQWLSLEDCIWTRSVLRDKYALMPSLNQYRGLFRDTLGVPNATIDMLIQELLESSIVDPMEDEDGYQYIKELLYEIARMQRNDEELEQLNGEACWPCHTPTCPRELCSIGRFYVNDRHDLFNIFSDVFAFLDFDFDASRDVADLLRNGGCDSFLSETVSIETEPYEPLVYNNSLTQDLRSRADALVKYFQHESCESPYDLQPLLESVEVWMSENIKTHYTLETTTVTKSEGGSNVKVKKSEGNSGKLEVYLSSNKHMRECALITDFPEQLVEALELEPADLTDLHLLLQVPLDSLNALLIRKGITGGDVTCDYEETLVEDSANEDSQSQNDDSSDDHSDDVRWRSASSVLLGSTGVAAVESTLASARSAATNATLRAQVIHRIRSRQTTPEPRLQDHVNLIPDESARERPVTPRPAGAGLYSTDNRSRNRERLQSFARNAGLASNPRPRRSSGQNDGGGDAFDLVTLRETLEAAEPAPVLTPVQVNPSPRRRARLIPNRNEDEMARDFEVGFLGEQFVYNLLHDILALPNFTGEDNWTSSLRNRAGFSDFGREVSDFTYADTHGALTRHFQQMRHPYATPEWLSTACDGGNVPLYRLEVKSTTNQDPTTTFYMSSSQHKLAKRLRVTSGTPSEIYVVLRVSGLDALENGAEHQPQWRVYLDPYARGEEGFLNFVAPTYAVTATA